MTKTIRTVDERLSAAAALFKERNASYGSNYTQFGKIMCALEPAGIVVDPGTEDLWGRLMLVSHLVTKLSRYTQNLTRGGHADSLEDLSVYSQMLAEWDDMWRGRQNEATSA